MPTPTSTRCWGPAGGPGRPAMGLRVALATPSWATTACWCSARCVRACMRACVRPGCSAAPPPGGPHRPTPPPPPQKPKSGKLSVPLPVNLPSIKKVRARSPRTHARTCATPACTRPQHLLPALLPAPAPHPAPSQRPTRTRAGARRQ